MNIKQIASLACVAAVLGACAQQEEAPDIRPQPVYDKYGGGSCEDGYTYIPGTTVQPDECIPDDECEPGMTSPAAGIPCPPPRRGDDDRDDSSTTGRSPTGSGSTAGT